jgi:hypothetical protein
MRSSRAWFLLLVGACAPDQPPATVGCNALADCPLGQVCDQSVGQCIDEPENRFLGGFQCTITEPTSESSQAPGASEVVGRIGTNRWSLAGTAFCTLQGDTLQLGFVDVLSQAFGLSVTVSATEAATGQVALMPCFGECVDAATMENSSTFTRFGSSSSGRVAFSPPPSVGAQVTGYLDVFMTPAASGDALFGATCPNGIADCGTTTFEGGGVGQCGIVPPGTLCMRNCNGNGDCSVGNGVCVSGTCTKSCASSADCTAPLECVAGDAGEGSGCL